MERSEGNKPNGRGGRCFAHIFEPCNFRRAGSEPPGVANKHRSKGDEKMGFWKVCLRPRVGPLFYVVIQSSTAAQAVDRALARYPDCMLNGSPSPTSGPEC